MTEYELIYLSSEQLNRTWSLLQFWASISFGLIAVSHFANKHLNLAMILTLTVLYLAFTGFIASIIGLNEHVVEGFLEELANKATLSKGAQNLITSAPGGGKMIFIFTAFFGTFLGVICFLWYSYWLVIKESRGQANKHRATSSAVEKVIQTQFEAYNRKDATAWAATYAEDAVQLNWEGDVIAHGRKQIKTNILPRFSQPNLQAILLERKVYGNIVIDHEVIEGQASSEMGSTSDKQELLCIYTVHNACIQRAQFKML